MSALSDFRSSDVMLFPAGIAFHVVPPFGDPFDSRSSQPLAISKTDLSFVINARLFLPDLDCDLNVRFNGTAMENADGSATISWEGTPVGSLDGIRCFGVVVPTSITARIVTRITSVDPVLGTNTLDMTQRVLRTAIALEGSSQSIVVNGRIGLSDITATVNLTEANGSGGNRMTPVHFRVNIRASNLEADGCGSSFAVQGNTSRFAALIDDESTTGMVTGITYRWQYKWQDEASFRDVPDNASFFNLSLTRTGNLTVKVNVVLTTNFDTGSGFETGSQERIATWSVLTAEEMEQRKMICRLRQKAQRVHLSPTRLLRGVGAGINIGGIRFVDPLWDPVPDEIANTVQRYSLPELFQLKKDLEDMIAQASAALKSTDLVLAGQKKAFALNVETQLKNKELKNFSNLTKGGVPKKMTGVK